MGKLSALLFFSLLPLLTSAQTLGGDPTGFGCSTCLLLDNPAELVPCSDAWRQLMTVCSTPACASYASYVSKAPPVSSCTSTPLPLPGGSASAGISFGTLISLSRGSDTATGGPSLTSIGRSVAGPGTTTTRGTETGTGTTSREGLGGSGTTATPGSNNSTATGSSGSISGTAIAEPTLTGTGTDTGAGPQGTNSGFVTATGGVGRVVAGGLGVGWLWEAVFMFWGAVW